MHNLALKLNGYRDSVARFLRSLDLKIDSESMVLDAGSGTGIVTMALHKAGFRPKKTIAFDLSRNSLQLAIEQARKERVSTPKIYKPFRVMFSRFPLPIIHSILSCPVAF